ncbi:MAG: TraR/DksA family transcriptional regulator [Cytophagales bacterium]|nr:TraR/DksA family transcriptional regulator [Rhizobacter sp.]
MSPLTAQQTRSLELLLIEREKQLDAEIASARDATRQRNDARLGDVTDRKEGADQDVTEEVAEAETGRDITELNAVQAARLRLGAGLYGRCLDCAEPIAYARLQAQPAASRCARCQTGHEEKLGQQR